MRKRGFIEGAQRHQALRKGAGAPVGRHRSERRRVLRAPRTFGMRQDDPAAHTRGFRVAHGGRGVHRRPGDVGGAGEPAAGEHGLSELRDISAPERSSEHRLRSAPAEARQGRAGCGDRARAGPDQARRVRRAALRSALRRAAPTGGARAGAGQAAEGAPAGRALGRAGQALARADAGGAARPAAGGGSHLRVRDPRPGRGSVDVGPHRGHVRGRGAAGGHARAPLRATGVPRGRRLHRHHELRRGRSRRGGHEHDQRRCRPPGKGERGGGRADAPGPGRPGCSSPSGRRRSRSAGRSRISHPTSCAGRSPPPRISETAAISGSTSPDFRPRFPWRARTSCLCCTARMRRNRMPCG